MLKHYSVNTTEAGRFGWSIHVMLDCLSRITEHQNMIICATTSYFFFFVVNSHRWVLYSINHFSNIVLTPRSLQSVFKVEMKC